MTSFSLSTQQLEPINELYIFGDSLSDVGRVWQATGGTYPPKTTYFQGRYSNGRVWVEYLADRFNISSNQTHNFACGGATTTHNSNSLVPGLVTQIQSFTQTHQQLNPHALYVLWAGANDYLQGAASVTVPVENLTLAIASLADLGAKNILVGNLPDLGHLPATRSGANSVNLTALTQSHNQALRRSLKLLTQQYPQVQLATLDASTLYREAIANPSAFGFTNVMSACMSGASAVGNAEQFLFWDGIHPTTATHRILGEAAFSAIQAAGIVQTSLKL